MDLGVEAGVYDTEGMTRVRFPSLAAGVSGDTSEALIERYTWQDDATLAPKEGEATLPTAATEYLTTVTPLNEVVEEPDPDQVERLRALGYIEPEEAEEPEGAEEDSSESDAPPAG